ncbi:MAG: NAD-dependent deacylase [Desulfobacterales bacterium]|jgi:NAD-dependent deacetylase|nr:NAD-dependent deacylase [Desulfobacterales bacterium]
MGTNLSQAADLLAISRVTIALTGAGISVESGIAPFRGRGGVWEKFDPFEYAHIDSYRKHPDKIWKEFLFPLVQTLNKAEPNNGHKGLAKLEDLGLLKAVITQNVDGLHQRSGNTEVIEFHGSFARHRCMSCERRLQTSELDLAVLPPRCHCGGIFRPECVFFGEMIPAEAMKKAHQLSTQCEVMLVVGTSAVVQPAAMIPETAKESGAKIIEINPDRTPLTHRVTDVFLQGSAGELLPRLVAAVARVR